MLVRDVMTASPACARPDDSLETVARLMVRCDCGSIPVCDGNASHRVIGIITDRDIVIRSVAAGRCPLKLKVRDVMSHPVAMIHDDAPLITAIHLLETNRVRRLPVVDSLGNLCGMISQADVARNTLPSQAGDLVQQVSQSIFLGND